ncbi:MAG: hypothetical protein Kow0059_04370 [Candidatus Sumerlaeia bacterium]
MILFELVLGWLIPGSCYWLKKDWLRGTLIFIILQGTFVIGIALHGGVLWPVWNYKAEGFNAINILTFFSQMGNGASAALSLLTDWSHLGIVHMTPIFNSDEQAATFELGSFYLLIAGAMNYFSVVGFYDRFYGKRRAEADKAESRPQGNDTGNHSNAGRS